jgi:uncharacterized protein YkwD
MIPKKLLSILIFSLLFAAACTQTAPVTVIPADSKTPKSPIKPSVDGISQSQTTPTPSPEPTATTQSQPTTTAQPQSTATAQPESTLPTQNPSNCTDSASFVADVTIPDNTTINQGMTFLKTWRIRNTGTCTWNENYKMIFLNGDQMNSDASIPFKTTAPGDLLDLSVNLVSPSTDGAYTGNYELHNGAGDLFLIDNTRTIWVKIMVGTQAAQKAVPAGKGEARQPSAASPNNTPSNGTAGTCSYYEDSAIENDLVSQINAVRAAYDLPALTRNAKLSTAALSHSIDMACHSSISHYGSDGSTITGRMAAYGYSYSYWNEAIYAQPPEYGGNAQAAIDWWLNDPPHRVIILSPDAKDIGPGYAYVAGSKLGGYFTIDVGAR